MDDASQNVISPLTGNAEKELEAFGENAAEIEKQDFNPLHRQALAACAPIILTITGGMVSGFSAILLPQLNEENSIIKVNKEQESWIASVAPLPMALGCMFCGWTMDRFGRKPSIIGPAFLSIAGWLCIYFGTTIEFLLLGRLLTGFSIGASGPSVTCYIAEVSHPKYRGIFLACISLGIALGLFISHLIGTFLSWKATTLIIICFPCLAILLQIFVPESHAWYFNKNELKEAKEKFRWFRGYGQEATDELMNILSSQTKNNNNRTLKELIKECSRPQFIKPLMILNLFFVTVQLAGNNAVVFYSVAIMQSTVTNIDKYVAMLIVDSIRVVMSLVACYLTKKCRVRLLTMVSGLGTAFCLYFLALFVYLGKVQPDNSFFRTMPILALIGYIIFISIGLVPLPWSICGEILHPSTKGVASGISTSINFLMFFLVVKTSPDMFESLGTSGTFITYASLALLGTGILYFVLPETKNKTLKDIEAYFVGKAKIENDKI